MFGEKRKNNRLTTFHNALAIRLRSEKDGPVWVSWLNVAIKNK